MMLRARCTLLLLFVTAGAAAQGVFDPSWYRAGGSVKIGVVQDGVYRVTGAELAARGLSLAGADAGRLELIERGRSIPFLRLGSSGPTLAATDTLVFVGRRNRGTEESLWAYDTPSSQGSSHFSLYSDTTYYWLRVGTGTGRTYGALPILTTAGPVRTTVRDTVHAEEDRIGYEGDSDNSGHPLYTRGEGQYWFQYSHAGANVLESTLNLPLPGRVAGDDSVVVRARVSGTSASRHRALLSLGLTSGFGTPAVSDWTGYSFRDLRATAAGSALPSGESVTVRFQSTNEFLGNPNVVSLDFFEAAYTRAARAQGEQDRLPMPAGDQHLRLTGYGSAARVLAFAPDLGLMAMLPATGGEAVLATPLTAATVVWTSTPARLLTPARIEGKDAPALAALNGADYVIVTTPALRTSAEALAAYHRAQNGFEVAVVMQKDVFEQFDYGRPTPLAIRRFVYASQAWRRPARFLTLWGDALSTARTRSLEPWEVLTFGSAPSDAWFAMQRGGPNDYTEALRIGRIPIRTDANGVRFVQKLNTYEHAATGPWQRRSLHVSGGLNTGERATLRSYHESWQALEARAPVAMDTLKLYKNSDLVVDGVYRERIREELQRGASWYTFFGHSSPQIWEVLTDAPAEFNNALRLPLVLSLGCRTGAFTLGTATLNTTSLSEQLVVGTLNGGIAHWGASELSSILPSGSLSGEAHRLVFVDTLRVIGDVFREAKRRYLTQAGAGGARYVLQYGLIGDPATRLQIPTRPDLHVEASDIAFAQEVPVVSEGQLDVAVRLHSYGLVPADSVSLALTHTGPGAAPVVYRRRVAAFNDTLTVRFTLPLMSASAGEHRVDVVVDDAGQFAEASEADNRAERRITVFSSGLAIASPTPYGVTGPTPVLRVAPFSAGADVLNVRFQLDTTRTFASPVRREHLASGTAAIERAVAPRLDEGRTYFWRARIEDPQQTGVWVNGSFTVRSDLTSGALLQGETLAASLSADAIEQDGRGAWRFRTSGQRIEVSAERTGCTCELKGQISVGNATFLPVTLGWGIVVLDGNTGRIRHAESYATYVMPADLEVRFNTNEAKARRRLDSLASTARPGDYVLARARFLANLSGPAIHATDRASMRRLGSIAVDTLDYGDLWLMVARVGDPTMRYEQVISIGGTNEIVKDTSLAFAVAEGTLTGPLFGPALRWERGEVRVGLAGAASGRVDVLAADGTVLLAAQPVNQPLVLSGISAQTHPTLRLRATLTDTSRVSTPQLQRLTALFTPVPDVVLDGAGFTLSSETPSEGQPVRASVPVVSLGQIGTTDVLVRYFVTDAGNRETLVATDTLRALGPGERRTSTRDLATRGLVGRNRLRIAAQQAGAAETVVTNNTLLRPFTVARDAEKPAFTVRIDGESFPADPEPVRNLRDDRYPFVSTRPQIEIVARDGNAFLPIADTSAFTLTLDGKRVRLGTGAVQFQPANGIQPEARLVFSPDLSQSDTTHTLTLRVYDASRNEAAGSPYQVHFRVSRTSAVEQVLPYPNPMHERTTFAFRLRGDDAAAVEDFRLRIFTLTGTLVREFDLVRDPSGLTAGALRIGWNRLRWDGTDADGDPVGTGVYLYRVSVRARGEALAVEDGARVERLVVIR